MMLNNNNNKKEEKHKIKTDSFVVLSSQFFVTLMTSNIFSLTNTTTTMTKSLYNVWTAFPFNLYRIECSIIMLQNEPDE